jgi:oligopeptide/dipeptide ABC transporter ATP-binding protein
MTPDALTPTTPEAPSAARGPVLRVRDLTVGFRTDAGRVTAVDGVSFDLYAAETLGIVGESGCGKTVTSKAILRLLPAATSFIGRGSEVRFRDRDLLRLGERAMRRVRGEGIAMVFQEPMTSLNPVFTVGWQLEEALRLHTALGRAARRRRAIEMLELVEIPNPQQRVREYPHQLSGGMRQRVMIAMALSCEPEVLIADEPTTALDVTIQAQILKLLLGLKQRLDTAIILITHDLGVVAQVCDRVLVMYAGRVVESGSVRDIFHHPQHPYTKALLESIPRSGARVAGRRLPTIEGMVPSLSALPPGCRFVERCRYRQEHCELTEPALESTLTGRLVRCHYPVGSTPEERGPGDGTG